MSDHERGAYTPPTDAPLSFDARQPVRGSRPMPVALILSILVLLGVGVVLVMFYKSGVRHAGEAPRAVGAPVAGMKSPPPAEAQPQDPAAGLQIYKSENGKPADAITPQFAPAPEQPQSRVQVPAPTPPVTQAPLAQPGPAAAAPTLRPALPAQPPAAATPAAPPPTAKPETPKAPPQPVAVAKAEPPPKPLAKAEAPKAEPAKPAPAKAAPAKPAPAKPEPKAEAKAPAPAADKSGGVAVQIGAVSSEALADKAWSDAAAVAPGLAAGKGKSVEKIDRDGKTLFRTQVTGFADRAAATAFCDKLKAAGKACFVK